MRNFKLTVSYDGTNYCGWQIQKGQPSVQKVLERAVHAITRERVRVLAAGRTDSGVHALGQVAHFCSKTKLGCRQLRRAINSKLPSDIRILKVEEAPADFHARYWAKSKTYQYRIWQGEALPVFERNTLLHHPGPLHLDAMRKVARLLVGRHDFSSFAANSHWEKGFKASSVRSMERVSISKKGTLLTIELEADGFLYKMVRSIVGTLLEVGEGKLAVAEFKNVFLKRSRSWAGQTAPPQGLCLMKVKY